MAITMLFGAMAFAQSGDPRKQDRMKNDPRKNHPAKPADTMKKYDTKKGDGTQQ
jgi:hypothetical protein